MQKISLYCALTLLIAFSVLDNSCTKKVNGPDNNTIVETPFSLFFSDTAGTLFSSNDGKTVRATLFGSDGAPSRAICAVNDNILWAKSSLLISTNNGVNFNHAFDSLTSFPFRTCDSFNSDLNQSIIINVPDWGMVFSCSSNPDASNYLGVVYSLNVGGIAGSWWGDLPDSTGDIGAYSGNYPITMTSYTYLPAGILCGYDAEHNRNFYRVKTSLWNETTANVDSGAEDVGNQTNHTGVRLPHRDIHYFAGSGVPSTADSFAWYSYGHLNNRLIAIDNRSCNSGGAYYSDDTGRTWNPYSGLPAAPLLCISSPWEEICLVGTYKQGLYFLNQQTNAFQQQTNNGLPVGIIIRNIAFKQNMYKDGSIAKYIFLATNKGIYESTNGGGNWALTIPGNFVTIY